ncbi:MAG: GNAT family N-acetyltransferase [Rhodoblastus sp.]
MEDAAFATDRLTRRAFRGRMASASCTLIVAASGARIVGYGLVEFRRNSRLARLFSLARAPNVQRGVGRALLTACETEALRRGCRTLRLESREDNVRALRLYQGADYAIFSRVEDYYEDGAPALRLEKNLIQDR